MATIRVASFSAEHALAEAASLDEALAWLHPKERMAVLQDAGLVASLSKLPYTPASPPIVRAVR